MEKQERFFSNDTGDAAITVYEVFPGVELAYYTIHMDQLDLDTGEENLIEIHHCREGRIEQQFENEYFYLMPGDLSVTMRRKQADVFRFPLQHYHGINIRINPALASSRVSPILREIQVQPQETARKLCGDKDAFIVRSEQYIEHIFSELYHVPECIREGYFKVKVLELLLVLSSLDLEERRISVPTLPKSQVHLANQAAAYLSENMGERITIAELSRRFNVSDTHLKSVFKAVYGVPIFSYMRIQRMQSAAQLLIHTERSIGEIACEFGYANAGKFTVAFQKIMGDNPSDYRQAHKKY